MTKILRNILVAAFVINVMLLIVAVVRDASGAIILLHAGSAVLCAIAARGN